MRDAFWWGCLPELPSELLQIRDLPRAVKSPVPSNGPNTLGEVHSMTSLDTSTSQQESATSSSPEIAMILLFHATGGHIPKLFLDLASYPQQRFDKDGK